MKDHLQHSLLKMDYKNKMENCNLFNLIKTIISIYIIEIYK